MFLAGVEPGEFEQRLGELAHGLGGLEAGAEGLAVFGGGTFAGEGGLGLGDHDGERGAQFMGGVGGELSLLGEGGLEPGEGGVQDGGEPAEFVVGIGEIDAFGEVAGGDAAGGGADGVDGLERAAGEGPAAAEARPRTAIPARANHPPKRRMARSSVVICRPASTQSPNSVS